MAKKFRIELYEDYENYPTQEPVVYECDRFFVQADDKNKWAHANSDFSDDMFFIAAVYQSYKKLIKDNTNPVNLTAEAIETICENLPSVRCSKEEVTA